ncbi:MAG: amino acid adenylation domain-containing protein [Bacteroidota bacterium]
MSEKFDPKSLTGSQYLIWTGQKIHPNVPLYNVPFSYRISGDLNPDVFEAAFKNLVAQTDSLRTIVREESDRPVQIVKKELDFSFDFIDFQNKEEAANKWIEEEVNRRFDLGKILFHSALLRIASGDFIWYINQHHIITDAWSSVILLKRLDLLYKSQVTKSDEEKNFPQFETYRTYELEARNMAPLESSTYWKKVRDEVVYSKILGTESQFTTNAKRVSFELNQERSDKLRQLASKDSFRTFTIDLALYNIFSTLIFAYLRRVTQQTKISFLTPAHNRTSPEFKEAAGVFISFYPILLEIEQAETFVSLHKKVQHTLNSYFKHIHPGLSTADLTRNVNVVFNYNNTRLGTFNNLHVAGTYHHPGHNDPQHDLLFQVHDFNDTGRFQIHLDLKTDLFSDQMIRFISDQFINMVDSLLENPEQLIDKISVLGTEERQFLVEGLNNSKEDYPEETLLQGFDRAVCHYPNHPAVQCEDQILTYQSLDQLANQFSRYLRDQCKLNEGDVVAILMDRSLEMAVALYGILKAGLVYLPIDPSFPSERVNYLLTDSGAKVALTQSHLRYLIPEDSQIELVDSLDFLERFKTTSLNPERAINDIYCILYTSGSTGNPKGVMLHHAGSTNNLYWLQQTYPLASGDSILQKTPLTFDVAIWEFFWPLRAGAKLVITKPGGHNDFQYLVDMMRIHKVHSIHIVPSILRELLKVQSIKACTDLKYVFSGGEALTPSIRDEFVKVLPHTQLDQQYAPTETAIGVSFWVCERRGNEKRLPIGKPVANSQFYIVDQYGELNPFGLPGELYIGGVQVTPGYLNQATRTSAKFIEDKIGDGHFKLYKTGDIVRHRKDGALEFLGREDNQANIRGMRIELGEIQSAISKINNVEQVIVLAIEAEEEEKMLCAFIKKADKEETVNCKGSLIGQLPPYMIPSQFVFLDEFPLMTSGKIDQQKMNLLAQQQSTQIENIQSTTIEPRNELEELIHDVWCEVFKLKRIGMNDNFLDLGGHSLLAIRITNKIKSTLELDIQMHMLFKYPTIASISQYLEQKIKRLLDQET